MYFDWLMEYLSLAQSGKNADIKTVVDDIDALIEMLSITPEAFERYCGKTTEDVKAAFQTPLTERERLLFRILYVNVKITQNIQSSRALLRRS